MVETVLKVEPAAKLHLKRLSENWDVVGEVAGDPMVKKADGVAKAEQRALFRQQMENEESAMQSFLNECRACLSPKDWEEHFKAARQAGNTFHIVHYFVFVLAENQTPIPSGLRKSIDEMLQALKLERCDCKWDDLGRLNYGEYWKKRYGYK